jgi:ribokinase
VSPRVAVVGHVEWGEFAVVDHVPVTGEIVEACELFAVVAGGGTVAAVQLAKLAGAAEFFTVVGDDSFGEQSLLGLRSLGIAERAVVRAGTPQRRAFVFLDPGHERTITVLGDRLVPHGDDALAWGELDDIDAVYFTGGDIEALRHARRARVLVATSRALDVLRVGELPIDVLVLSANDAGEAYVAGQLSPEPAFVVRTHGAEGGSWVGADATTGTWAVAPLPGPKADAYGCGDSFAAGLTHGMADGRGIAGALELAARCGAACLTGRGPYAGQLEEAGPPDSQ